MDSLIADPFREFGIETNSDPSNSKESGGDAQKNGRKERVNQGLLGVTMTETIIMR